MSKIEKKSFDEPDSVREFVAKGHADLLELRGYRFERHTYEPGWRWSVDVAPVIGTEICQVPHLRYIISGRMCVEMTDGETAEAGPGEIVWIEPGHDGWVIGDEKCITLDYMLD